MAYSCIWDGFDDYNGTRELWDSVASPVYIAYSPAYARFPAAPNCVAQGVRIGNGAGKTKNYSTNVSGPIASFAIYFETLPSSGHIGFVNFMDGGSLQVFLAVNASGGLEVYGGAGGTTLLGATGPGICTAGVYYFVDFYPTIAASGATVKVFLSTAAGGGALLTLSGVSTAHTGHNYVNQVQIGDFNNSNKFMRFDDFHAHDDSGGTPNAVLGEGTRIYTKLANAAGALSQFSPAGAVSNFQCVNEQIPDDDATYVSAGTTFPKQDVYGVGLAGFTGTVNGLLRRGRIRKDDAGAHTFQEGIRSVATDAFSTAVSVLSNYAYTEYFSSIDPNTSAAWLAAGADAASLTIKAAS